MNLDPVNVSSLSPGKMLSFVRIGCWRDPGEGRRFLFQVLGSSSRQAPAVCMASAAPGSCSTRSFCNAQLQWCMQFPGGVPLAWLLLWRSFSCPSTPLDASQPQWTSLPFSLGHTLSHEVWMSAQEGSGGSLYLIFLYPLELSLLLTSQSSHYFNPLLNNSLY